MNLGQFLTEHSPLPSGTVAQHLQALQFGTGSGGLVFASRLSVVIDEARLSIAERKSSAHVIDGGARTAYPRKNEAAVFVTSRPLRVVAEKTTDQTVIHRRVANPKVIEH